jgi:hypothetical protein
MENVLIIDLSGYSHLQWMKRILAVCTRVREVIRRRGLVAYVFLVDIHGLGCRVTRFVFFCNHVA